MSVVYAQTPTDARLIRALVRFLATTGCPEYLRVAVGEWLAGRDAGQG